MKKKITDKHKAFMEMAVNAERHGYQGICPQGSGQWQMVRTLARAGLMKFVGIGPDADRDDDREHPIYTITARGRAALLEVA